MKKKTFLIGLTPARLCDAFLTTFSPLKKVVYGQKTDSQMSDLKGLENMLIGFWITCLCFDSLHQRSISPTSLQAAFMGEDPKTAKKTSTSSVSFCAFGICV